MGTKLTQEEILKRAIEKHGEVYDYSKVVYVQMHQKITIGCREHGDFEVTPEKHTWRGQGCPKCGKKQAGISKRLSQSSAKMEGVIQPEDHRVIHLGNEVYVQVDIEDFENLKDHCWKLGTDGYARSTKLGSMHRFIMKPPKGMFVDHKSRVRLDNRRSNLRLVTPQENAFNSTPYGESKYKGVSWSANIQKWVTQIVYNGAFVFHKTFDCEIEAAKAYDKEITKYHGEFAYYNFKD